MASTPKTRRTTVRSTPHRPTSTRAARPTAAPHSERCADCGELTRNQRIVLDVVARAEKPIGAYGVLADLNAQGMRVMPPTVYRALEGLTAAKLVHRLESLNAYVACAEHDHAHDSLFLICTECGKAEEFSDPAAIAALSAHAATLGFEVARQVIELRGRCAQCRQPAG